MNVKLLSHSALVTAFFCFFAIGAVVLFWQNERERDPGFAKDWWLVAFTHPQNEESLDFRIENYSVDRDFHYRVLSQNQVVEEDGIRLLSGEGADVTIDAPVLKPVRIEVTSESEMKTLTRN